MQVDSSNPLDKSKMMIMKTATKTPRINKRSLILLGIQAREPINHPFNVFTIPKAKQQKAQLKTPRRFKAVSHSHDGCSLCLPNRHFEL